MLPDLSEQGPHLHRPPRGIGEDDKGRAHEKVTAAVKHMQHFGLLQHLMLFLVPFAAEQFLNELTPVLTFAQMNSSSKCL